MSSRVGMLSSRALGIYHEKGLLILIKRAFTFAKDAILSAISYENSEFYVTERVLRVEDETKYLQKLPTLLTR